ncbi:MAG TPA: hypothetical protein VNT76_03605 [Candidatus Binatus sp.]|nr:hypothetical protein [Candidatus Binatus sp.]
MINIFGTIILTYLLIGTPALAQITGEEHKHDDHQSTKGDPAKAAKSPAKMDAMKCCDEMEKKAGSKDATPMKDEMKAKMEKMKEMKTKMADKMKEKGADGMKMKEMKGGANTGEQEKADHQH